MLYKKRVTNLIPGRGEKGGGDYRVWWGLSDSWELLKIQTVSWEMRRFYLIAEIWKIYWLLDIAENYIGNWDPRTSSRSQIPLLLLPPLSKNIFFNQLYLKTNRRPLKYDSFVTKHRNYYNENIAIGDHDIERFSLECRK